MLSICLISGLTEDMNQAMCESLPQIEYALDGDTWVMTIIMPHISQTYHINSGQEVETTSIDGRQVKVSQGQVNIGHRQGKVTSYNTTSTVVRRWRLPALIVDRSRSGHHRSQAGQVQIHYHINSHERGRDYEQMEDEPR